MTVESTFIYRVVVVTLAAVIVCVVAALLVGLFDPRVDNDKIFPIVGHAFDTITGAFVGILSGLVMGKQSRKEGE
jgi:hypothetical protein